VKHIFIRDVLFITQTIINLKNETITEDERQAQRKKAISTVKLTYTLVVSIPWGAYLPWIMQQQG